MEPIIRTVLSALVTPEEAAEIDIISNHVDVQADGTWSIKYRHPTRYVEFIWCHGEPPRTELVHTFVERYVCVDALQ